MAGAFQLTLDTTGPGGVALTLDAGNPAWSTDFVVDAIATTTDPDTTGYQVKFWGPGVAGATLEADATWQTLTPSIAVTLTGGDGAKTVNCRLRDDVWNESAVATDTITVDTTAPTITLVAGPTPARISKVAGKDTSTLQWKPDDDIQAYKVKVVANPSALQDTGAQIPVTAGSSNVTGGAVAANTTITTTIKGADYETASPGDATKDVKVFVQDLAGNWSVL